MKIGNQIKVLLSIALFLFCLAGYVLAAVPQVPVQQRPIEPNRVINKPITLPQGTITITKPTAEATWYTGGSQSINWTCNNTKTNVVDVTLWKDGKQLVVIANDTTTGSAEYTVPWYIATGRYEIRVTGADPRVQAVQAVNITPTLITITNPKENDKWYTGGTYPIAWSIQGTQTKMEASIARFTNTPVTIGSDLSGSTSFTVPTDWITEGAYVNVRAMGYNGLTKSQRINIVPASLTITSPKENDAWATGGTYEITWQSLGNPGPLEIELFNNTDTFTIAQNVPTTAGRYSWKVLSLRNATFKVRLTSQGTNAITAVSPNFEIKSPYIRYYINGIAPYAYFLKPFKIEWQHFAAGTTVNIKITDPSDKTVYHFAPNIPIGANGKGEYNSWIPMVPPSPDNAHPVRYKITLKSSLGFEDWEEVVEYF